MALLSVVVLLRQIIPIFPQNSHDLVMWLKIWQSWSRVTPVLPNLLWIFTCFGYFNSQIKVHFWHNYEKKSLKWKIFEKINVAKWEFCMQPKKALKFIFFCCSASWNMITWFFDKLSYTENGILLNELVLIPQSTVC